MILLYSILCTLNNTSTPVLLKISSAIFPPLLPQKYGTTGHNAIQKLIDNIIQVLNFCHSVYFQHFQRFYVWISIETKRVAIFFQPSFWDAPFPSHESSEVQNRTWSRDISIHEHCINYTLRWLGKREFA